MGMTGNKYRSQVHDAESAGVSWERRRPVGKLQDWGLKNSPAGRQRSQIENTPRNFIYGH
jgi:hypothetical protein